MPLIGSGYDERVKKLKYSTIQTGSKSSIGNRWCEHVFLDMSYCLRVDSGQASWRDINPFTETIATAFQPYDVLGLYLYTRMSCIGLSYGPYLAMAGNTQTGTFEITQSCAVREGSVYFERFSFNRDTSGKFQSARLQSYHFTQYTARQVKLVACVYDQLEEDGEFILSSKVEQYISCRDYDFAFSFPVMDPRAFYESRKLYLEYNTKRFSTFKTFGDLSNDCATKGGKATSVGSAQYLIELNQLKSILQPFSLAIGGAWTAKNLASAWLGYNYGTQQTAKDTYNLVSSLMRQTNRTIKDFDRLRSTDYKSFLLPNDIKVSGYRALTVYYRVCEDWIRSSYAALRKWNLNPSTNLAWDLVPLSFVVDWFLPIGQALEHFDGKTYLSTLSIIESLLTEKLTYVLPSFYCFGSGYTGTVQLRVYSRRIQYNTVPAPTFEPRAVDFNGMHFINGASLAIQRHR